MAEPLPADDYERLVEQLMAQLAETTSVSTERLERPPQRLPGVSGTTHQIDVLWEFVAPDGDRWRLLFEARSYRTALKQAAVFAFNGVVRDIAALTDRRCVGIMVTFTGYQVGARTVGESNGVLLLELRAPTEADTTGRVMQINVSVVARSPILRNVFVELVDGPAEERTFGWMEIEYPDGSRRGLGDVLVDGESAPLGQPPALFHPVKRSFTGVERLLRDGEAVGSLRLVTAEVGDSDAPFDFSVGGLDRIAWMLRNAVTGARVWFAHDGRHWSTDT